MPLSTIFCNQCGLSTTDDALFCQRCGAALAIPVRVLSPTSWPMGSVHYGGFWIRVVAAFIDYFAIFAASFPVRLLFGSVVTALGTSVELPIQRVFLARRIVRIAIGVLLVFAYRTTMESSTLQATLGKMALRFQVTDLGGNRISYGRAVGRHFAKYLSLLSLGLGFLMAGFDEEKQGLHDRVAGTLVVYRKRVP